RRAAYPRPEPPETRRPPHRSRHARPALSITRSTASAAGWTQTYLSLQSDFIMQCQMPLLRDIADIRAALEIDRVWAAYPLGDLARGFFEHCDWFQSDSDTRALAVLYRAYTPPVLFTQGAPAGLATILDEFTTDPWAYL